MRRWHALGQLILARFREFYREPEVLFWVYGFPVLLAVGLGIAFSSREPAPPVIDLQETSAVEELKALQAGLAQQGVQVEVHSEEECRQRLRVGKTELFVVPSVGEYEYVYDPARPESLVARHRVDALVQRWKSGANSWPTKDITIQEPGSRYIDFLLPGLMGLNLMGGGLWGVGFVMVDLRVRKLLKRLIATPMNRGDFLLSIILSRMVFVIPEMVLLLLVGILAFGVPLRGNPLTLLLVIFTGAIAFDGIGLLVGCRTEKTETASGLMNLVMLPMWLLSGTFFSSKRFPDVAQPFIQALPLTQLNDALREVMLEGSSLTGVGGRIAILFIWGIASFVLALRFFRWK